MAATGAAAVKAALTALCRVLRSQGVAFAVDPETVRQAKFDGPVVSRERHSLRIAPILRRTDLCVFPKTEPYCL